VLDLVESGEPLPSPPVRRPHLDHESAVLADQTASPGHADCKPPHAREEVRPDRLAASLQVVIGDGVVVGFGWKPWTGNLWTFPAACRAGRIDGRFRFPPSFLSLFRF
jgi:hypothetical protein